MTPFSEFSYGYNVVLNEQTWKDSAKRLSPQSDRDILHTLTPQKKIEKDFWYNLRPHHNERINIAN